MTEREITPSEEFTELNPILDIRRAKRLVYSHGIEWAYFVRENGEHDEYKTKDIFDWLGY